jgi:type I restriction enzyme M protein
MTDSGMLVQKLWNYCNVLRDDGVSYGDYVEQLTYLLFLKMADELTKPPYKRESIIPVAFDWNSLSSKDGDDLEIHYRHALENLGKSKGMLGVIFRKSQNKIQDPAKLKRLIKLIDEETWSGLDVDLKGEIYEGLLEKNAEDIKSGAGQYFTPRALIKGMVTVMKLQPNSTICDPACGTGGFLLASHDYLKNNYKLDKDQLSFLKLNTFKGWEIVDSAARLCVMNLFLHGIGGEDSPISVSDSLASPPIENFDYVLTNPPFGKKSSITIINEDGKADKESIMYERNDFWASTSNKQLNFVQHIKSLLKINGKAAVVRKKLLHECDVHTLLRLPTGIFYAQGVKANVIFFDKKPASEKPWTKDLCIYDLRTNMHFTLKTNTLKYSDLEDFISNYNPSNRHERKETERFKKFTYDEIIKRDKTSLDIFWLKDDSIEDSANLPSPEVLAQEIADNLEDALEQMMGIINSFVKE